MQSKLRNLETSKPSNHETRNLEKQDIYKVQPFKPKNLELYNPSLEPGELELHNSFLEPEELELYNPSFEPGEPELHNPSFEPG